MDPNLPPSLRILCFGASITAGFYRLGLLHHPYAIRLEQRLQHALPSSKIGIDIDALSGDTVIGGQYVRRLQPHLSKTAASQYDWIIVQGGGNDLAYGRTPEQIYEELKRIWTLGLSSGAKVLALTVTETANRNANMRARYDALNKMINMHCDERFYVADVCSAMPWPEGTADQRKIWDDGLHFTKEGYNMLGDAIASALSNSIRGSITPRI